MAFRLPFALLAPVVVATVSVGSPTQVGVGGMPHEGQVHTVTPPLLGVSDAGVQDARRAARGRDRLAARGHRDTSDFALDEDVVPGALASSREGANGPLLAIDGDDDTAWRGALGEPTWSLALPFSRVVHVGLIRTVFGDSAARGVPSAYHWERLAPASDGESCAPGARWENLDGAASDDRDPNTFVHGPIDVHARRRALFLDVAACGLRLVIDAMAEGQAPVVRTIHMLESATSLARLPGAEIGEGEPARAGRSLGDHGPLAAIDGRYETYWRPSPNAGSPWSLTVQLAAPTVIDRVALVLGFDAVSLPRKAASGRDYAGANLPDSYVIETNPDGDEAHWQAITEASLPERNGQPLPLRRRLLHLASPRLARAVRLRILHTSGTLGAPEDPAARPVVRDFGVFAASDRRPVVREPLFLSVNANPSRLTAARKGGEANADGEGARALYHRLRRIVTGFDIDTHWTADASRKPTDGVGRFLEAIEGDDPLLNERFLQSVEPPPIVLLSGAFDWEFDRTTEPSATKHGHWRWNVLAPPEGEGDGMAQLEAAVRARAAPFLGFCGGAQILSLFEARARLPANADTFDIIDAVLLRNGNAPIRGLLTQKSPYERAWWYDAPPLDAARPVIRFAPDDPLFRTLAGEGRRRASREIPSSHGDMIRSSAFAPGAPLDRFELSASSEFCRPWVDPHGPEPTSPDQRDTASRCVRIPQAFHTRANDPGYPIVGFQFHPEQRDLKRLAPGSPPEARGDAMNILANAVDMVLESYLHNYWPDA